MLNANLRRSLFVTVNLSLLALAVAVPVIAHAQANETLLYSFCSVGGSSCTDGGDPYSAGVIFDSHGNLYGTTSSGGAGWGTVFELSPPSGGTGPWTETVLYNFCSVLPDCTDGAEPSAGLVFDSKGNLYGTTSYGGAINFNDGVVFELSPPSGGTGPWTETVLHSFCTLSECADGVKAEGGLVLDSEGNLYGTTTLGGLATCTYDAEFPGCGVVYELSPPSGGTGPWTETLLWTFGSGSDGAQSYGRLMFDSQGNLYGTTYSGGMNNGGTVFEMSPPGGGTGPWTEAVLYSFCYGSSCTNGWGPQAGLIFDSKGNLYGTTPYGGIPSCGDGCGTAFELSPPGGGTGPWTENVLWSFDAGSQGKYEGLTPYAGLILDSRGNLYGATAAGGNYSGSLSSYGVVFELTACAYPAVSLISSQNPSTGGQTVGFTATVSPAPTYTLGLGSISFKANGVVIGTEGLLTADDGVATLNYSNLAASGSPYSMVATYNPFPGSSQCGNTSAALSQTVSAEPTTTGLGVNNTSPTFGQSVMLTATVSSTNGATPPGTVSFKNGTALLGNVALKASGAGQSQAVLNVTTLPVGSNSITATYDGSNLMQTSTSNSSTVTVSQASTTTAVTASPVSPSTGAETVTFTATVTPAFGGGVTGEVTFLNGSTSIGIVAVNTAGVAKLNYAALTPGSAHNITAVYAGSTNLTTSTSPILPYTVNADTTTTSLTNSPSTSSATQPVTLTATVTPGNGVAATGTVSFFGSTTAPYNILLGNATLSGGVATLTHTFTKAGSYMLYAVYDGSVYKSSSPSTTLTQTVK
ncbi:MAG: Ig-like domain repeat protein [Terriglobales bacterium]